MQILATGSAFAALKNDGSVITWGDPSSGGDSSRVSGQLSSGVVGFANPLTDDRLLIDIMPTYRLTASSSRTNEGTALATTVSTSNVASGTTLYSSVSGTGVNAADFSSGALTGSEAVGTDGKFSLSHTLANDLTTEGDETLQIKLFSDSARTIQVGSTASVTVKDTSIPVVRGNSLYTIVDGPSWTQAETNSVKLGGHLVALSTNEEDAFVWDSFKSNYWIGLTDQASPGNWKWINGDTSTYTNWAPGNPNNAGGAQHYAWYWNDAPSKWDDNINDSIIPGKGITETPFIRRGDSAYVIVQGPTWEEAEANAVKLGGHLVTINDAEENQWIARTFGLRDDLAHWDHTDPDDVYFWIGLHDIDYDGTYQWSSDEPLLFTNWQPGNPYAVREDIYIAYGEIGYTADGKWNNISYNLYHSSQIGIAEIKLAPNNTPTGTPSLSGNSKAGQVISIDQTQIQDVDNFTGYTPNYNYSFEVSNDNGTTWTKLNTSDATDNTTTYTLTTAEVGKQIRGVVSYLDGYGTNEVVASDASTLVIGNQAPTDLSLSSSAFIENIATASVIGSFGSADPDADNTFIYSLVSGIGSTDNATFSISGNQLKINLIRQQPPQNSGRPLE